jgi:glutamine synthetase
MCSPSIGLAWAPGAFFNQDGTTDPYCTRGTLSRLEERLTEAGIDTVAGTRWNSFTSAPTAVSCRRICGRSTDWSPLSPVATADQLVLIRIIIGRVARRYSLRVSLSPVPFAGSVGSAAHQHSSMKRDQTPLFSGGEGTGGPSNPQDAAMLGLALCGIERGPSLPPETAVDPAKLAGEQRAQSGTI